MKCLPPGTVSSVFGSLLCLLRAKLRRSRLLAPQQARAVLPANPGWPSHQLSLGTGRVSALSYLSLLSLHGSVTCHLRLPQPLGLSSPCPLPLALCMSVSPCPSVWLLLPSSLSLCLYFSVSQCQVLAIVIVRGHPEDSPPLCCLSGAREVSV